MISSHYNMLRPNHDLKELEAKGPFWYLGL